MNDIKRYFPKASSDRFDEYKNIESLDGIVLRENWKNDLDLRKIIFGKCVLGKYWWPYQGGRTLYNNQIRLLDR